MNERTINNLIRKRAIMSPRNEYSELATLIQSTINPLVNKLQVLETKVDNLNQDRVTRTDLEKLRGEIVGSFVDRASYEARHSALIERCTQLDVACKDLRRDVDQDLQKIHDRLESGKEMIEQRFKQEQERPWVRVSQVAGVLAVLFVIVEFFLTHVKF